MTVDIESLLRDLTDTERRIVEFFLKNGGSARDIAEALNVSERTVYKALYKYRKIAREKGLDPSAFYLRGTLQLPSPSPNNPPPLPSEAIENLKKELLKELSEVLERSIRESILSVFEEISAASSLRYNQVPTVKPSQSIIEDSETLLFRRLTENLERLNYNIERLTLRLETLPSDMITSKMVSVHQRSEDNSASRNTLPSFVQDNPWIEVLQKKKL